VRWIREHETRVHKQKQIDDPSALFCQFNSKTLFKDVDPVGLQLIFPGVIQTCKQIQQVFIHVYKIAQVHQTITGKHNLHFHTKHIHKDSYLTYTMYIQFMTYSYH